jgi:hypothetical protein
VGHDARRGEQDIPARARLRIAEVSLVDDYFKIVETGPTFFVSAWLLMIFAGIASEDVGIRPFGYLAAIVVTIGLWLVLAPAIGAIARTGKAKKC